MANLQQSAKRILVNKANTVMVTSLAIASFIVVFSIFSSKALLSQRAYQARVITKKEAARDQLKKNVDAIGPLINSYKSFVGTSQNIIGGNPNGTGPMDGDSAKIILDALPDTYDFPALTSSLQGLFNQPGIQVGGISGSDAGSDSANSAPSNNPAPVPIEFSVSASGNYQSIQNLISVVERSIRPITISNITYSGSDSDLQLSFEATTYYQPPKSLKLSTQVVK